MQEWVTPAAIGSVSVLYVVSLYNRLVALRHNVDQRGPTSTCC